jgi:hypothetical protein
LRQMVHPYLLICTQFLGPLEHLPSFFVTFYLDSFPRKLQSNHKQQIFFQKFQYSERSELR